MSCTKKIALLFLVSELLPFDYSFFFKQALCAPYLYNRMEYLDET